MDKNFSDDARDRVSYYLSNDLPSLKGADDTDKISVYLSQKAGKLYRIGKQNGHDTPEIVRQILNEALIALEKKLLVPKKK